MTNFIQFFILKHYNLMDENSLVIVVKDMYRRREGDKVVGLKILCPSTATTIVDLTVVSWWFWRLLYYSRNSIIFLQEEMRIYKIIYLLKMILFSKLFDNGLQKLMWDYGIFSNIHIFTLKGVICSIYDLYTQSLHNSIRVQNIFICLFID